jgi:hypothetical protein
MPFIEVKIIILTKETNSEISILLSSSNFNRLSNKITNITDTWLN